MKKKVLILLFVAILAAAPAMAASTKGSSSDGSFGIGLNLGTNTGLGMKFGMGKFDILANVGLANFNIGSNGFNLGGDVAVSYEVYDIHIKGEHHMPITVGLGAAMNFRFADQFGFDLSIVVPVGLEYQIPDVPIAFYLRLAPGLAIMENTNINLNFGFAGYIGVLWMFE